MNPLTSQCAECGRDAEFDPVPDAMPTEYICRRCAAAYLVDSASIGDAPPLHAVA
ncbi:hypothetical protein [Phytoactinopolyspora endophytica]|uniref:hypothetical protein n=1 Tax=Phytoactinopolyspora endophytica TaxID=1642495 RepID=UPI0013ECD302|nr:hypothetical protein [Phytoactinopolyspora endophytica]